MPLIEFTDKGLYCRQGGFYIDPWKPVERAIITHAHSDHAKWGHKYYLSHPDSIPVMRARLGEHVFEGLAWGETRYINNVRISLHPAGHIIGSSQVRVEYKDEVWIASGDYKVEDDGLSGAFEPVKCHTFISESTFGLPIYKWRPQPAIYESMRNWVTANEQEKRTSIFIAYSLGKAQRVLKALEPLGRKILVHGAVWNMQQALLSAGILLPEVERVTPETPKEILKNSIVIAPPGADGSPWLKKFQPYNIAVCSGWMQVRGNRRRRNADEGFALSDHADWPGLLEAIRANSAQKVFVTHGFQAAFSRYLNELGIESGEVKTEYGNEDEAADAEGGVPVPEEPATTKEKDEHAIAQAGEELEGLGQNLGKP